MSKMEVDEVERVEYFLWGGVFLIISESIWILYSQSSPWHREIASNFRRKFSSPQYLRWFSFTCVLVALPFLLFPSYVMSKDKKLSPKEIKIQNLQIASLQGGLAFGTAVAANVGYTLLPFAVAFILGFYFPFI